VKVNIGVFGDKFVGKSLAIEMRMKTIKVGVYNLQRTNAKGDKGDKKQVADTVVISMRIVSITPSTTYYRRLGKTNMLVCRDKNRYLRGKGSILIRNAVKKASDISHEELLIRLMKLALAAVLAHHILSIFAR